MARPKKDKSIVNRIDPQGWGSTSTVIAPEPEPADPIVLPAADEAVKVLERLAIANQQVSAAKLKYDEAASLAKTRKQKWERLSEELSRMLTEATSGSRTPLLDAAEGEADLAAMEQSIRAASAGAAAAPDVTSDVQPPDDAVDAMNALGGGSDADSAPADDAATHQPGNVLEFVLAPEVDSPPVPAESEIF
jgi:hypothetical protein